MFALCTMVSSNAGIKIRISWDMTKQLSLNMILSSTVQNPISRSKYGMFASCRQKLSSFLIQKTSLLPLKPMRFHTNLAAPTTKPWAKMR